jgi:hypothetical protein
VTGNPPKRIPGALAGKFGENAHHRNGTNVTDAAETVVGRKRGARTVEVVFQQHLLLNAFDQITAAGVFARVFKIAIRRTLFLRIDRISFQSRRTPQC